MLTIPINEIKINIPRGKKLGRKEDLQIVKRGQREQQRNGSETLQAEHESSYSGNL